MSFLSSKKAGEEYERFVGFYSDLRHVLHGYKQQRGRESDAKTFKELKQVLDGIDKRIEEIGKEIGI